MRVQIQKVDTGFIVTVIEDGSQPNQCHCRSADAVINFLTRILK